MKHLILLTLLGSFAAAQDYVLLRETSLTAAVESLTVQQPAASAKTVRFVNAWVDCSVACTVTVSRNGTAASSTALTPVPLINGNTAASTGWRSSNVGAGTTISIFSIPAGGGVPIDLSGIVLTGTGTTKNLTISTNSITGTVHVIIHYREGQ